MPKVEPAKIDSELAVTYAPGKTATGRISNAKKNRIASGGINQKYSADVPLVALIISAQANPNSKFNARTGGRYARSAHPLAGKPFGSSAALDAMRAAVNRLIRARHSSTGFFKTCAAVVQFIFAGADRGQNNFVAQPATDAGAATAGGGSVSKRIGVLAGGKVATAANKATASFWVTGTGADQEDALHKIAEPVWQRALDNEGRSMQKYAADAYAKAVRAAGFQVK